LAADFTAGILRAPSEPAAPSGVRRDRTFAEALAFGGPLTASCLHYYYVQFERSVATKPNRIIL
jgi:hypothetical protein